MKPKIGVLFLTSEWFRDVGLQESNSKLTLEIDKIAEEILSRLANFIKPVYNGIVYSETGAEKAAAQIRNACPEGLLISPLMWCEDQILITALKKLPELPIVFCTFFPYKTFGKYLEFQEMLKGSGSVGTLQMSGFLRRAGFRYQSVSGYYKSEDVYKEIKEHCLASSIKQNLKIAKCGVLPFRCDQMTTTYVDEFALQKLYGIKLKYLELSRFRDEAQSIKSDKIQSFKELLNKRGYFVEVDEKNLNEGIKYALAMEKIIIEEELNMLAMNDIIEEMHQCFGLRPCLINPNISNSGVVVAMEADIGACIAMYILRSFTLNAPFYTEIFTADLEKNALLMGHAGYHDPSNSDDKYPVKIVSDVEYKSSDPFTGACVYFKYKPGPVTVVNSVFNGEKLRWTVIEGNSLEGPPLLEGNCHLLCKVGIPLKEFYYKATQLGVSQHWIVIPGHCKKSLERLCGWLDIEYHTF